MHRFTLSCWLRFFYRDFFDASVLAVVICLACILPSVAWADCNDSADCQYVGNGATTTITPAYGGQSYSPTCAQVTDNCGADIMVPFITQAEWASFIGNHESCAAVVPCQPVNGQCGSDNGGSFSSAPWSAAPNGLCRGGSAVGESGGGPWTWECQGINGGGSQTCSAQVMGTCTATVPNGYETVTIPDSGIDISSTAERK